MERARGTWTDERLDDLSKSVDRVDEEVRQFRTEMSARLDSLVGRLGSRIDGIQRSMVQVGGGIVAALLAAAATVVATSV